MVDGRNVGKYIFSYNSTVICVICANFCTKTQNPSTMTVERQKLPILVIQDGGLICT